MKRQLSPKVPLLTAVCWIVGSVVLIAIVGMASLRHFSNQRQNQLNDPQQRIVKIIQTGPQKEALSSLYLAELMQLSIDRPYSMRSFDLGLAEKRLRNSRVIEKAKVSFDRPGVVVVDYAARRPVAWLHDFVNIGVDLHGVPFPMHPFYSPKKMPEIYLGESLTLRWNQRINHQKMELALSLLEMLLPAPFSIKRIDVGGAFAESCGKRQIVLMLEEQSKVVMQDHEITCIHPRILRLSTKDYRQELGNYVVLRDELSQKFDIKAARVDPDNKMAYLPEQIIDLRVTGAAFIQMDSRKLTP